MEGSKGVEEEGLGSWRTAEQIVPVFGADRPEATAVGGVAAESGGGLVAGRVGVVGAEGARYVEGMQPAGESGGEAGGGSDERVGGQGGSEQQDSGEGVEGGFNEQEGVEIVGAGGQPEAAMGLAGAGSHGLEGAAVGSGAGADDFGAGGLAAVIAAEEDGVAAGIGVEQAVTAAEFELVVIEAAGGDEEVANGRPEAVVAGRELKVGAWSGGSGAAGRGRSAGSGEAAAGVLEELDGRAEAAAAGVHDEVDGAAAAATAVVVEEARTGDGEDRAGALPAGRVARVGAVAELDGEGFEGGVADSVGAGGPEGSAGRGSHLASSWQLRSRCSPETVRALSRAAARRA